MKIRIIIAVITFTILVAGCNLFAQDNTNMPKKQSRFIDRLVTGGDLGAQFGNETMINIAPIVGYKITDKFVAGIGITYQYYRSKIYSTVFSTSIYGGSVFARYYIIQHFFLHAEYEALSLETRYFDPSFLVHKGNRFWIGSPMAGGGYSQPIGERAAFNIMILYNFNESIYSPYTNPVIRVGVSLGI